MRCLMIMAFTFLLFSSTGNCVEKISVNEIHESAGNNIVKSFIEDVVSLLPPDFRKHLDSEVILASVKFNGNRNKWRYYTTMPEKDLVNLYTRLANRYANYGIGDVALSDELGNTVSTIIEAAMTPAGNDPLGDRFKANLESFLKEEYKKTHVIKYDGHDGCQIKTCISRIYELAKTGKSAVYPSMVTSTADLWTAIYKSRKGELVTDAKSILRRPLNIAFSGRTSSPQPGESGAAKGMAGEGEVSTAGSKEATSKNVEPEPTIIILVPIR